MTYEIEILNPAKKDIQEAVDYYESRVTGLGTRFINQLRKASSQLIANPYYEVKYKNVRTIGMSVFPYLIHFIVFYCFGRETQDIDSGHCICGKETFGL